MNKENYGYRNAKCCANCDNIKAITVGFFCKVVDDVVGENNICNMHSITLEERQGEYFRFLNLK